MIRQHEFNTRWCGDPVGIVTDPAFFEMPDEKRAGLLATYKWVEFSAPLHDATDYLHRIRQAGFVQVDTQVNFRINLKKVPDSPGLADIRVQFADENLFSIDRGRLAPFVHERFFYIPEVDQQFIDHRYEIWGADLIARSPGLCMQLVYKNTVQGWFLSSAGEEKGINLTLAMLDHDAVISGMYLYQRAFRAYAERGHRIGHASFSVTNTPVHNIYASLGAHFLGPIGNWIWISDGR